MSIRQTISIVGLTALCGVAAIIALRMAVGMETNDLRETAWVAAAEAFLANEPGYTGDFYVRFDRGDPLPEELLVLSASNPELRLRRFSERSPVNDFCNNNKGKVVVGACQKDDFLEITYVPLLWRTALLDWRTSACQGSYIAFRLFGQWRLAPDPAGWSCI